MALRVYVRGYAHRMARRGYPVPHALVAACHARAAPVRAPVVLALQENPAPAPPAAAAIPQEEEGEGNDAQAEEAAQPVAVARPRRERGGTLKRRRRA